MPTTVANFNFLAGLVSEILTGSQNQKWGLLISSDAPQRTSFIWSPTYRSSVYCAFMKYVFAKGFPLYCWFFWRGLRVEM